MIPKSRQPEPSFLTEHAGRRSIAWFHCFAGIAGDMALSSLIDAGADVDEVRALLERLPIGGWRLDMEPALRAGVAASRAIVTVTDHVVVRTYAHIVGLIEEARLPPRVTRRALATFSALAEVEAALHRRPQDQVHFHEVGGHDAVVDIVGTAAALEVLGIDEVRASPVAMGTGMIRTAHGLLPNPAPAVLALLEGAPIWGRNLPVELTTPTGAALLAALSSGYGSIPPMRVTGQGFGAGSRELDELPNCTQVVLGLAADRRSGVALTPGHTGVVGRGPEGSGLHALDQPFDRPLDHTDAQQAVEEWDGDRDADAGQPVVVLETNVDDATGEELAHALATVMDAGALDAWITQVVMKKGRPGSVVHVLTEPARAAHLRELLRTTTGSLGVRMTDAERWPATRTFESVIVDGQPIRVKVSPVGIKAEHDDLVTASRRTGSSLRDLSQRAVAQWHLTQPAASKGEVHSAGSVSPKTVGEEVATPPRQDSEQAPDGATPIAEVAPLDKGATSSADPGGSNEPEPA